jgi:hypothetical protein
MAYLPLVLVLHLFSDCHWNYSLAIDLQKGYRRSDLSPYPCTCTISKFHAHVGRNLRTK